MIRSVCIGAIWRQRGLSLIELMVAMAAGLIVVGATLTFTVATVRANAENIQSTRLTNDLRTALNLVVREVRRAGYDAGALARTGTALAQSLAAPGTAIPLTAYSAINVSGECITFSYGRADAPTLEWKGFRRNAAAGTLQYIVSGAAPDCNAGAGWSDLTDAGVVNITAFQITQNLTPISDIIRQVSSGGSTVTTTANLTIRNYQIQLTGQLRSDTSFTRTLSEQVRTRGDSASLTTVVTTP